MTLTSPNLKELSRKEKLALASQLVTRSAEGEGLPLLAWSIANRPDLIPDRPFDLKHHLYLRDIYADTAQKVVVQKAAQMGLSEWLISYAFHGCDVRRATVLYTFPSLNLLSDFSRARLGPAIEASPYLQSIVGQAAEEARVARRRPDMVTLKRVRDRHLYLRGGQVRPDGKAPQLKAIDADIVILDEVDEMDPRVLPIAAHRLDASEIGEVRMVSTPTYPGVGIYVEYDASDQRVWMIKCDGCQYYQEITLDNVVTEYDALGRPLHWHGHPDEAFPLCLRCGAKVDRLAPGRWVARHPDREVHGYRMSHLISARTPVLKIVQGLMEVDPTIRKEVLNQHLGTVFVPRGTKLTNEQLDACRRDYLHGPVPGEEYVLGADVGNAIHVVVRALPQAGSRERPQRWAGIVPDFEALGIEMMRWRVKRAVIDAQPESRKARELQAKFDRGLVWLAYYKDGEDRRKDIMVWDENEGSVTAARTPVIDAMMAGLIGGESTLPIDARHIPDYYEQLCAPIRTIESKPGGVQVSRYVHTRPDHFAHSEVYVHMAAQIPASAIMESRVVPDHVVQRMFT